MAETETNNASVQNVLRWLRKYCCLVFQCTSKSEVYHPADETAQNDINDIAAQYPYDIPYSEDVNCQPVKTESGKFTSPTDRQTQKSIPADGLPFSSKSQSLRIKSHGVKLPGMSLLQKRRSIAVADEPSNHGYYNVNFAKRLIKKLNISDPDKQGREKDNYEKTETLEQNSKILDNNYDIVLHENEREQDSIIKKQCPTEQLTHSYKNVEIYDNITSLEEKVLFNGDGKDQDNISEKQCPFSAQITPSYNNFEIYDNVTSFDENLLLNPLVSPKRHPTNACRDSTEWEENPAYNKFQQSSVEVQPSAPTDGSLKKEDLYDEVFEENTNSNSLKNHCGTDTIEWEENPAYNELNKADEMLINNRSQKNADQHGYSNGNLGLLEKQISSEDTAENTMNKRILSNESSHNSEIDEVFEEGWEENPGYSTWSKSTQRKAESIRSDKVSFMRSPISPQTRSRSYTESMMIRTNFQKDLKLALNSRRKKQIDD